MIDMTHSFACIVVAAGLLACAEEDRGPAAGDGGATEPTPQASEPPAGFTIAPPSLAERPIDALLAGTFDGFPGYDLVAGHAQLLRFGDGTTEVQVYLDGLTPGVTYPTHVHVQPCDVSQGGGHYKIDPGVEEALEENEIWPSATADGAGVAISRVRVAHAARGDARSVVVHDPEAENARLACADLRFPGPPGWRATGDFAPFASASEADGPIRGTAALTVDEGGTLVEVALEGLRPEQRYGAHLHDLPCHVGGGGGHYKIDPTIDETLEENELWPPLDVDGEGSATGRLTSPHPVRANAQSVVVHRRDGDANPKVACADLVRRQELPVTRTGVAAVLPAAAERGLPGLAAEGSLTRRLDGTTAALLGAQGLAPNARYVAHLHTQSCAVEVGGGHYKIDPEVEDASAGNELWIEVLTDGAGAGVQQSTADHLVRPEGVSIVIHDTPGDGARLACIELR